MTYIIADRYELGDQIGAGGMGVVYDGYDHRDGKPVAIKMLATTALQQYADAMTRFEYEAALLRRLNHPNIVAVIDVVQDDNRQIYLMMELVTGGSLKEVIERGPLELERAIQIALELADALARAHHLDVLHRDIKPSNVLLADNGTPRLSDFGLATVLTQGQIPRGQEMVAGTPPYLSPEMLQSYPVSHTSDIWSFGVLLFEMLTGRKPFLGNTFHETAAQIIVSPIPDIQAMQPAIPTPLADLVYRCLDRNPQTRINSMRLVGAELEALRRGTPLNLAKQAQDDTNDAAPTADFLHNIPLAPTELIGRDDDVAAVLALLTQHRMVSLLGPGGIGKTRLAIEIGDHILADATLRHRFRDGVWLVRLDALNGPDEVVAAIARVAHFHFYEADDQREQLTRYLRRRHTLLILDNLEHVMGAAEDIAYLLDHAPNLTVLVTSRESTNLSHEQRYLLDGIGAEDEYSPATRLFVKTARRVVHDFTPTYGDLMAIQAIAQHVGGLPLGIILAGSWLELLSPAEIEGQLAANLNALDSPVIGTPARHQSLQAVFDYSWGLLTPPQQVALARLSLMAGYFERDAAVAVSGQGLPTLLSLVNKSLLGRDRHGRFVFQSYIHYHAAARFEDLPAADQHAAQQAHVAHYRAVAEGYLHTAATTMRDAVDASDIDLPNLKAATRYAAQRHLTESAAVLLNWLRRYNSIRFNDLDLRQLFQEVLPLLATAVPQTDENYVQIWLGYTHLIRDRAEFTDHVARLAAMVDDHYPLSIQADVAERQGRVALNMADVEAALQHYHTAVVAYRQSNNPWGLAWALNNLSRVYGMHRNDFETAISYVRESIRLMQSMGDDRGLGSGLNGLAILYLMHDDTALGIDALNGARAAFQRANHPVGEAVVLYNLGWLAYESGEFMRARHLLEQSMTLREAVGRTIDTYGTFTRLAFVELALGELDNARHYLLSSHDLMQTEWDTFEAFTFLVVLGIYINAIGHPQAALNLWQWVLDNAPARAGIMSSAQSNMAALLERGLQPQPLHGDVETLVAQMVRYLG